MKIFLPAAMLFLLVPQSVTDKAPRAIEHVKVALVGTDDGESSELLVDVRKNLGKSRRFAFEFVGELSRAHFELTLSAFTSRCGGYVGVMVRTDANGRGGLNVFEGDTLDTLAGLIADRFQSQVDDGLHRNQTK